MAVQQHRVIIGEQHGIGRALGEGLVTWCGPPPVEDFLGRDPSKNSKFLKNLANFKKLKYTK